MYQTSIAVTVEDPVVVEQEHDSTFGTTPPAQLELAEVVFRATA